MFPAFRYHHDKGAKLVKSAEEFAALGAGWQDNPGKAGLMPVERMGQMEYDKDPAFKAAAPVEGAPAGEAKPAAKGKAK